MSIKTLRELVSFAKENNLKSVKLDGVEFTFFDKVASTPEFKEPPQSLMKSDMPSDEDMLLWSTSEQLEIEREPSEDQKIAKDIEQDGLSKL